MLIEEVGKNQSLLQRVRDPREKGRIWDNIIANLQDSTNASLSLKDRTKQSVQQKWDNLLQKYRNIKDTITTTGEEAIQNDWEFFDDMDEHMKKDPSITAPVTSDSINRVKRKQPKTKNKDDDDDDEVIVVGGFFNNNYYIK